MSTEQHETILRVEHLSKAYALPNGRLQVLQDIQFQGQRGEFLAITCNKRHKFLNVVFRSIHSQRPMCYNPLQENTHQIKGSN